MNVFRLRLIGILHSIYLRTSTVGVSVSGFRVLVLQLARVQSSSGRSIQYYYHGSEDL